MDVKWIGNARRQKAEPVWVAIAAAANCEHSRAAFATRRSSYDGFCELDRGGRTVGKRLGVRSPSMSNDGFDVALAQCVGARVGAEGDGFCGDPDWCTAAALLETRKASLRVVRVVLGRYSAHRVSGLSAVMTGVSNGRCW